ncbi:hypothetical protein T10_292 [Trichinella papuae]|uniref:Uncharacterized protein n=1 Tax=Trichinella papuae TaxID=268474 RepID=A0A0V1N9K3_9BILA|nr:hypothetical protein T10_292 [Trichinella papuae]
MCVMAEPRMFREHLGASIHTPPAPDALSIVPESYKSKLWVCSCMQACQNFMHYVFTQILRYSHAVLDCASLKAEVWTFPDMSGPVDQSGLSVWNRGTGAAVNQLPVRSATFPFTLLFLSFST